jgi:hypothetical protein
MQSELSLREGEKVSLKSFKQIQDKCQFRLSDLLRVMTTAAALELVKMIEMSIFKKNFLLKESKLNS